MVITGRHHSVIFISEQKSSSRPTLYFVTLHHSSVALKHARNGHAQCDTKPNTALAQQSLSKTSVCLQLPPLPPQMSLRCCAPLGYLATHGVALSVLSVPKEVWELETELVTVPRGRPAVSPSISSSVSPSLFLITFVVQTVEGRPYCRWQFCTILRGS